MVFFSSRISPRTSTVILRDRSPRATAVVTSAMLRTWSVRLRAIALTESVRSFHVPATPGTHGLAAEPALGADLAAPRASLRDANERSWSTIVLMASLSCRISPRTSTVILRGQVAAGDGDGDLGDVAHLSGQVAGHRVDAVGEVLPDAADTLRTSAWPPSLPSVPTSRATRVTSEVNTPSCSIIVLTMVAERRNSPSSGRPSTSRRTVCEQVALGDGRERAGHLGRRPAAGRRSAC